MGGFWNSRRVNIVRIELSDVLAEIVRVYQVIVHFPVLWVFGWLNWPSPAPWAIDAVVLWLLIGGVILRSVLALRKQALRVSASIAPPEARERVVKEWRLRRLPMQRMLEWQGSSVMWHVSFIAFAIGYLLLWPWPLRAMLLTPRIYRLRDWRYQLDFLVPSAHRRRDKEYDRGSLISEATFLYDMRIVLATQAVTAVLCIAAWFGINAFLNLYG